MPADIPSWLELVRDRVWPVAGPAAGPAADPGTGLLTAYGIVATLVLALLAGSIGPLWWGLRLAVTLVHELGHAVAGVLVGRRFTGFVVRGDASGHAVTVGRARGFGRVVTTWAGYPAPFVAGAGLVVAASRGWAAPVLTGVLVGLVLALVRVRSVLTFAVVVLVGVGLGSLWWWRSDMLQARVLVGVGVVLVVGGWRHLLAVARSGDPRDDPAVLAGLTRVPRVLWLVAFALVGAVTSLYAAHLLLVALGVPGLLG